MPVPSREKADHIQSFKERVYAARDGKPAETLEQQESMQTLDRLFSDREARVRDFYKDKKAPAEIEQEVHKEKQKLAGQLTQAWSAGVESGNSTQIKIDKDTAINTFKGIIGGEGLTGALTSFVMSIPLVGDYLGAIGNVVGSLISSVFDKSVKPIGFGEALKDIRDTKMRVGGIQGLVDQKLISGDDAQSLLSELNGPAPIVAQVPPASGVTVSDLAKNAPAPVVIPGSEVTYLPDGTNVVSNVSANSGQPAAGNVVR